MLAILTSLLLSHFSFGDVCTDTTKKDNCTNNSQCTWLDDDASDRSKGSCVSARQNRAYVVEDKCAAAKKSVQKNSVKLLNECRKAMATYKSRIEGAGDGEDELNLDSSISRKDREISPNKLMFDGDCTKLIKECIAGVNDTVSSGSVNTKSSCPTPLSTQDFDKSETAKRSQVSKYDDKLEDFPKKIEQMTNDCAQKNQDARERITKLEAEIAKTQKDASNEQKKAYNEAKAAETELNSKISKAESKKASYDQVKAQIPSRFAAQVAALETDKNRKCKAELNAEIAKRTAAKQSGLKSGSTGMVSSEANNRQTLAKNLAGIKSACYEDYLASLEGLRQSENESNLAVEAQIAEVAQSIADLKNQLTQANTEVTAAITEIATNANSRVKDLTQQRQNAATAAEETAKLCQQNLKNLQTQQTNMRTKMQQAENNLASIYDTAPIEAAQDLYSEIKGDWRDVVQYCYNNDPSAPGTGQKIDIDYQFLKSIGVAQ